MASEFEKHLKETLNELSKHLNKENVTMSQKTLLILDAKFKLLSICWDKMNEYLENNSFEISEPFNQLRAMVEGQF